MNGDDPVEQVSTWRHEKIYEKIYSMASQCSTVEDMSCAAYGVRCRFVNRSKHTAAEHNINTLIDLNFFRYRLDKTLSRGYLIDFNSILRGIHIFEEMFEWIAFSRQALVHSKITRITESTSSRIEDGGGAGEGCIRDANCQRFYRGEENNRNFRCIEQELWPLSPEHCRLCPVLPRYTAAHSMRRSGPMATYAR